MERAARPLDGLLDLQRSLVEIDVLQAKAEQFAAPQPHGRGDQVQGVKPMIFDHAQERLDLVDVETFPVLYLGEVTLTSLATLRDSNSSRIACWRAFRSTA